jgi:hypothetical protein
MLVVIKPYRGKGIGQCLSSKLPCPYNVGKGCSLPLVHYHLELFIMFYFLHIGVVSEGVRVTDDSVHKKKMVFL